MRAVVMTAPLIEKKEINDIYRNRIIYEKIF